MTRYNRWTKKKYYKKQGMHNLATYPGKLQNIAKYAYLGYKYGRLAHAVLNSEKKFKDINYSQTPDSSTGVVENILGNISQGDTNNTHDGNSLRLKSLLTFATFTINASATGTTNIAWAIVQDTRAQGSTPAWTDVFNAASPSAFTNVEAQAGRFHIIKKGFVILGNSASNNIVAQVYRKHYKKLDLKVRYDDSNNVIDNPIYFMTFSNEATNTPTVAVRQRVSFYDN